MPDDVFMEDNLFPWLASEEMASADPGDMDGDHETGLASAGWGTDEDYGFFGEEDW